MPKTRPLVQEALVKHIGPIADKVLTSGIARLSGHGYRFTLTTAVVTRGEFPRLEIYGSVHYDHVGKRIGELRGEKRRYSDISLHFDHWKTLEAFGPKYGRALSQRGWAWLQIMGDDYPDLHLHQFRQILDNDLLPLIARNAELEAYDELLNHLPLEPSPYLHAFQHAVRGLVARSLHRLEDWESLIDPYTEMLRSINKRVKQPFFDIVELLRAHQE